jgi:glycosyltransferase involved in cell wall biosynthesis
LKPRVLILSNILAPYRIPLFNYLAASQIGQFHIAFLAERTHDREWLVYRHEILFDSEMLRGFHIFIPRLRWTLHFNPTVLRVLMSFRPHIVIAGGWDAPAYWLALLYRRMFPGTRLVVWGGSNLLNRTLTRPLEYLKSTFVKYCDSCIAYNTEAARYLTLLGTNPNRIVVGYNVGDIEYFSTAADAFRRSEDYNVTRRQYPACLFIYVGSLIPRKRPDLVIEALSTIKHADIGLFIVGNGPQYEALQRLADELMPGKVWFWGHQQREDLAKLYALTDVFILPTMQEPGSIVLSEALASGLYVIASKFDGTAHDLVIPGVNGDIVDPMDLTAVVDTIGQVLHRWNGEGFRRETIRESIASYDVRHYAHAFERAIQVALEGKGES